MSDAVRLDTINEALTALRRGEFVIVVDDEDRENEGDFIMAAEKVTPEAINFVAKHGRGLVCLAGHRSERLRELDLQPMVDHNTARSARHFTVTVEARPRASPPASPLPTDRAPCRSSSIRMRAPADLVQPGHIFPLRGRARGRAAPRRPHRGRGRPVHRRGALPGGDPLRDHGRRRHHGPPAANCARSPTSSA